jgi:hypothetical protein
VVQSAGSFGGPDPSQTAKAYLFNSWLLRNVLHMRYNTIPQYPTNDIRTHPEVEVVDIPRM